MKNLGDDVISQIAHEIEVIDFNSNSKYERLKQILLNKFSETDKQKLQKHFGSCKLNRGYERAR